MGPGGEDPLSYSCLSHVRNGNEKRVWSGLSPGPHPMSILYGQKPLTSSRPPVTVLPLREAVGTAEPRIADLICAAVSPGWVEA